MRGAVPKWFQTLAVVLCLGCAALFLGQAGCAPSPDIVGTWRLTYDWDCNGDPAMTEWYIRADGTFNTAEGHPGAWRTVGDRVTLTYQVGTVYTGRVAGDSMDGTMRDYEGDTGCWSATRTATRGIEDGPHGDDSAG